MKDSFDLKKRFDSAFDAFIESGGIEDFVTIHSLNEFWLWEETEAAVYGFCLGLYQRDFDKSNS